MTDPWFFFVSFENYWSDLTFQSRHLLQRFAQTRADVILFSLTVEIL